MSTCDMQAKKIRLSSHCHLVFDIFTPPQFLMASPWHDWIKIPIPPLFLNLTLVLAMPHCDLPVFVFLWISCNDLGVSSQRYVGHVVAFYWALCLC